MKTPRMMQVIAPALLALVLIAPAALRADEAKPDKKLTKNQEKYDADQDGKLSDEEKAAAKQAAREKAKATHEANLAKYDANKDGKLDDEEKARKHADEQAEKDARKAEREARKAEKEAKKAEKE